MRRFQAQAVLAGCIAILAVPLSAIAQEAAAPPPPQLERLEEGEEPAVTIRPPQREQRITQKRAPGGKVTEVQVTSGGSTYYLKANDQAGSTLPGDAQSNLIRAAQWLVLEFDAYPTEEERQAQVQAAAETPPPPPPTGD